MPRSLRSRVNKGRHHRSKKSQCELRWLEPEYSVVMRWSSFYKNILVTLTKVVLQQPGGPCNRIPRGGSRDNLWNFMKIVLLVCWRTQHVEGERKSKRVGTWWSTPYAWVAIRPLLSVSEFKFKYYLRISGRGWLTCFTSSRAAMSSQEIWLTSGVIPRREEAPTFCSAQSKSSRSTQWLWLYMCVQYHKSQNHTNMVKGVCLTCCQLLNFSSWPSLPPLGRVKQGLHQHILGICPRYLLCTVKETDSN